MSCSYPIPDKYFACPQATFQVISFPGVILQLVRTHSLRRRIQLVPSLASVVPSRVLVPYTTYYKYVGDPHTSTLNRGVGL